MKTLVVVDVSPSYSNTQGKVVQHQCHYTLPQPQPGSRTPAEDVVGRTWEFRERMAVSGTPMYVDTNSAKATAKGKNDVNAVESVMGTDRVAPAEVVVMEEGNIRLH